MRATINGASRGLSCGKRKAPAAGWLGLTVLGTVACSDPLLPVQTVVGLRVLGARVDAMEEPGRAELRAAEPARVSWLIASSEEERFTAEALFCQATRVGFAAPSCQQSFDEQVVDGDTKEDLSFEFQLPASFPEDSEWLVELRLCPEGERARGSECSDGSLAVEAFLRGTVDTGNANHNPDLGDDTIRWDDEVWATSSEALGAGDDCDEDLVRLRAGRSVVIDFEMQGEDREPLPDAADHYAANPRESMLYAQLSTLPGLAAPYSAIDFDTRSRRFDVELALEPELRLSESGEVAHFFLVARDGRGGTDWIRRSYCAVGR